MDEVEDFPLICLLFLDEGNFPLLFDRAVSEGWGQLCLFLCETDRLRMDIQKRNKSSGSDGSYGVVHLARIFEDYLLDKDSLVAKTARDAGVNVDAICELVHSSIPLRAVFSLVCEVVWKDVLRRGQRMTDTSIRSGASLSTIRRAVVDEDSGGGKIELLTILLNPVYRKYYERFVQRNPGES